MELGSKTSYTNKLKNVERLAYLSYLQVAFRLQCYDDLTSSQGGVPSWKCSNFTPVYLIIIIIIIIMIIMIIIVIIKSLFKEDNILSKITYLTYGPL